MRSNGESNDKVTRGRWIKHETYGFGEVLAVTRSIVHVNFLICGERLVKPGTVELAPDFDPARQQRRFEYLRISSDHTVPRWLHGGKRA
jgi:hypothetical protein